MVGTHDRLHRTAALSALVGAACVAAVAFTPTAATAAAYACRNGVLYEDGASLGAHTKSNPYDLGGGITTWCSGDRIVTAYRVPDS